MNGTFMNNEHPAKRARRSGVPFTFSHSEGNIFYDCFLDLSSCILANDYISPEGTVTVTDMSLVPTQYSRIVHSEHKFLLGDSGELHYNMVVDQCGDYCLEWILYTWKSKNIPVCIEELHTGITAKGAYIRALKSERADKATIDNAVGDLLAMKKQFKTLTGYDYPNKLLL